MDFIMVAKVPLPLLFRACACTSWSLSSCASLAYSARALAACSVAACSNHIILWMRDHTSCPLPTLNEETTILGPSMANICATEIGSSSAQAKDLRRELGGILHVHEVLLQPVDAGCVRAGGSKLLIQQLSEVVPLLEHLLQHFSRPQA